MYARGGSHEWVHQDWTSQGPPLVAEARGGTRRDTSTTGVFILPPPYNKGFILISIIKEKLDD